MQIRNEDPVHAFRCGPRHVSVIWKLVARYSVVTNVHVHIVVRMYKLSFHSKYNFVALHKCGGKFKFKA